MKKLVLALTGVLLVAFATAPAHAKKSDHSSSSGSGESSSSGPKRLFGTYTFHLKPATSFAPVYDGTAGKPDSGVASAPRQDILRVGVFTADGAGHLTGHTIATTDDGLTTWIIDFTWAGTYTVSADGTGTISMNPTDSEVINSCVDGDGAAVVGCEAAEGAETYAFVLNRHGEQKGLSLIQTDNAGGGAKIFLTGEARKRGPEDW